MEEREAYERQLEERLAAMSAEIDALRARAARAGEIEAEDLREDIADAHLRRETLRLKLAELRAADAHGWRDKRAEIEGGWSDLDAVIRRLHSRF